MRNLIKNGVIAILSVLLVMNMIVMTELWHQNDILSKRIDVEAEQNASNTYDIEELTKNVNKLSEKVDD